MNREAWSHPLPSLASETALPPLRRSALVVVSLYCLAVAALLGVAGVRLPGSPPFAGLYGLTLLLTEGCTACLLCNLATISCRASILLLACAYLLSAEMAFLHILTFPGAVLDGVPLVGGPQTASILFVTWS